VIAERHCSSFQYNVQRRLRAELASSSAHPAQHRHKRRLSPSSGYTVFNDVTGARSSENHKQWSRQDARPVSARWAVDHDQRLSRSGKPSCEVLGKWNCGRTPTPRLIFDIPCADSTISMAWRLVPGASSRPARAGVGIGSIPQNSGVRDVVAIEYPASARSRKFVADI